MSDRGTGVAVAQRTMEVCAPEPGRTMERITILNHCHHFRGFVYQRARFSADQKSIEVSALVRAWQKQHPNVHLHFTPTCASWLNQVQIWLGMITRDCIRRGIFRSAPDLVHKILTYIRQYNRNAQPFRWTYANPKKRIRVSLTSVTQY